jgi:predicted porin
MKKALLPLIIASLLPPATFADVIVYGKANVALQSSDKNVGGEFTEVVSNASRIGIKGSESINDDLKVIYQFEYETKVDDGNNSNNQTFSQRNSYVGLQGSGGTATIGFFDTPLKAAQEKVDLFNDLVGDLKSVLEGEVRAKNIVQYSTPAFGDITVNLAYVSTEQDKVNATNGYSASVAYSTKNIYLALAADQNSKNATEQKTPVDDTDIIRAVGRFVVGPVVLGAMWETYDNGVVDEDGYLLSAQWNLNEKWALKVQHAQSDMIQLDGKSTSIGADYKLSKATKLFGYYTLLEDERLNATTKLIDDAARVDDKYLAVGVEINF